MAYAKNQTDVDDLQFLFGDLKLSTDFKGNSETDVENLQALIEDLTEENFHDTMRILLLMDLEAAIDYCVYLLFTFHKENPHFTDGYAELVSILNAKWPQLGEKLVRALICDFRNGTVKESYDKCVTSASFLTHLIVREVIPQDVVNQLLEYLLTVPSGFTIWACFKLYREEFRYFSLAEDRLRKWLHDVNDLIRSGELVLERNDLETFYDFQSYVDYTMEKNESMDFN